MNYTLTPKSIPMGFCPHCKQGVKISFAGHCTTCQSFRPLTPTHHKFVGHIKSWVENGITYEQHPDL